MKRLFSLLLALVLLLSSFPMATLEVSAEESAGTVDNGIVFAGTRKATARFDYPENDELFAGYTDSVFFGGSATYNMATGKLQTSTSNSTMYANAAGNRLSGDTKKLYNALVPIIKEIAAGDRSATTIYIADKYDADADIADAVISFSGGWNDWDLDLLHDALLADLPYEQYWYDKTTGVSVTGWEDGYGTLSSMEFQFTVAGNYRGYGMYYTDTTKTSAATTAAANAKKIVASNKSKTDYQKLVAYRDAICDRVEYDFDAVYYGDFTADNDPWQMIHAFDNDPSTNIVCEGYSKAYMYLCDQSSFTGDVTCYTVTGDAGGPHMWNVVTIGGKNYLVDITNSDSGSIGQNGGLFLAGGSGSVTGGYSFMNGRMYFYYDYDTTNLWGTGSSSILKLSSTDYTPPAELKITTQPKDTCVAKGETAKVTVKATGDGLTYQWYYKNSGATSFSKSSTTTSSYSVKMSNAVSGRQVYCVVKDSAGNSVKSKVVSLDQEATITTQPKTVCVAKGATAKATVKAVGKDLTYQWYFKNAGATSYTKSSNTTATYSAKMSNAISGRKVYCIVKDSYGNSVKTNVVTLYQEATITTQPKTVCVAKGATAKATVKAVGAGLTYQWYFKNAGATSYTKSSNTTATYSAKMSNAISGRKVYCIVKDSYGNSVKSSVVTLYQEATITTQPTSKTVELGATAKTTVKAVGAGLTYQWYYKNPGATSYSKSSTTTATYSMKMTQGASGRKVYCIVKDSYGNSVKSNVVTLKAK